MMSPSDYVDEYIGMNVGLDDESQWPVCVDQYLSNTGNQKVINAGRVRDVLINAMARETGTSHISSTFAIDGETVSRMGMMRSSWGKGSPDEVGDFLWIASRYGLIHLREPRPNHTGIHALTLQHFADTYLGMDCNGFLVNYYNTRAREWIGSYDNAHLRRKSIDEIQPRDAMIYLVPGRTVHRQRKDRATGEMRTVDVSEPYVHVAVVNDVLSRGNPMMLEKADWGGSGQHVFIQRLQIHTNRQGQVYADGFETGMQVYFCPPPDDASDPCP
jgi:hypothetical protein